MSDPLVPADPFAPLPAGAYQPYPPFLEDATVGETDPVRLPPSVSPLIVKLPLGFYGNIERDSHALDEQRRQAAISRGVDRFEPDALEAIRAQTDNRAAFFINGTTNYKTSKSAFAVLLAAYRKNGAATLSAALGPHVRLDRGLSPVFGTDEHVLQPDWRMEPAIILERLHRALADSSLALGAADYLDIIGHSKGALVAHSLASPLLLDGFQPHSGRFSREAIETFPGLAEVPAHVARETIPLLKRSRVIGLGAPVEGAGENLPAQLLSAAFLADIARYLSADFLNEHYRRIGAGPERMDHLFTTRLPPLRESLRLGYEPKNAFEKGAAMLVRLANHPIGLALGAYDGDGIVPAYLEQWNNHRVLSVRTDHIHQPEHPEVFREMMEWIHLGRATAPRASASRQDPLPHSGQREAARPGRHSRQPGRLQRATTGFKSMVSRFK